MNPFRSFMFTLSRIPPAFMLAGIIGLAVFVSMLVADKYNQHSQTLADKEREMNEKLNRMGTVVYCTKDVNEGTTIPADALEEKKIEASKIPQDALTTTSLATGRVAKYGISQGHIVSQHDLAPQGLQLGFESRLKEGYRAITFGVDGNTGVAGFVNPQSRVDVISMVGTGAETKVAPILSDVEVIAVGQVFQKTSGETSAMPSSSVTVAVSPEDGSKLIKAVAASKLYLALRNSNDHTPLATVDVTQLFNNRKVLGLHAMDAPQIGMALPPPPSASNPPPLPTFPTLPNEQNVLRSADAPTVAPHEIEIWSGSRKDVAVVPKS